MAALPRARDAQDAFLGWLGPARLAEFGRVLDDVLAAEGLASVAGRTVNQITKDDA